MLPITMQSDKDQDLKPSSKSAVELLSSLLLKKVCAYRLESFWTYELCHGKHIRQYHEEKAPGGKVKIQEYYLGYFQEKPDENDLFSSLNPEVLPQKPEDVESRMIAGVRTPYFSIYMEDGTPCGLKNGAKRKTKVLYMCHEQSRNEIMSISETSSCEYELIVLTPLLCKNPLYKIEDVPVNEIYCVPLDGAPNKPQALALTEEKVHDDSESIAKFAKTPTDTDESNKNDDINISEPTVDNMHKVEPKIHTATDKALMKDFLNGAFCLFGGTGWWKYEFCYGKHVIQYHNDPKLGKTVILVGTWDKQNHIEWVKTNKPKIYKNEVDPNTKLPSTEVKIIQNFYSNGDMCEESGKKREVVVKLKCMQSKGSSHSVSIYLLEPKTCSYVLGVESPIICDLLQNTDENGLFIE